MSDEKKDIEVLDGEVEVEGEETDVLRVFHLPRPQQQFLLAHAEQFPGCLVLINDSMDVGFAIPFEYMHTLAHMIHEALQINGFVPEEGDAETDSKIILPN